MSKACSLWPFCNGNLKGQIISTIELTGGLWTERLGLFFESPHDKNHSISGSLLESLYFGKWDARSSDYGSYTPRWTLRVCVASSFRLRGTVSVGV